MDKKLIGLAALASAGLASICCLGPLIAAGLGLGSLGLAAGLSKYRPLFLTMTGVVLAVAFYLAYRKRSVACVDGSCELRSGGRAMKAGVWMVAALAAAMATFPSWSGRLVSNASVAVPTGAEILALKVSGMDCAACTAAIKQSVEKVPGVLSADIDFSGGRATVVSDGKVDPGAVIRAVEAVGYKAELLNGAGHE
ncbi:MAG: mercuric transporter MerT family protein [Elusimicrobiota bacterium]|nr:MAG: mercuric transporter MerT family protein [Elusimicrobiota bacterium]